jgi:tetratricopeptide (TPR) repeat protein
VLQTLGKLELDGSDLKRPKPLLLLAYLSLEGPQERRHLSELFWPEATNGLASLSTALYRISKDAEDSVDADELRVWSLVETDAQTLLAQLDSPSWNRSLYQGAFLQGLFLPGWSSELEEWVYETRERIAKRVQKALLQLAEKTASLGQFKEAATQAEEACKLPGATELEPEDLSRYYSLLVAGNNAHAEVVLQLANEYGIGLEQNATTAQTQLRKIFVGRDSELERLSQLKAGQWAYLKGGSGIGKTSLLQQLPGIYVAGRAGLPFVTLEPLIGDALSNGKEAITQRLLKQEGRLLLDDWELVDLESREILERLRTLRSKLEVIITGREALPFSVDVMIDLQPLSQTALETALYSQTGGVPRLVGAQLRGEPLAEALEVTLATLPETTRHVYLALALLNNADLSLVRQALELSAPDLATALESLLRSGLSETSGQVRARELAQEYLQARPVLHSDIALKLARCLDDKEAFPLYQVARSLWTSEDAAKARQSYLAWGAETLERGFPQHAARLLEDLTPDAEVAYLRSSALEQAGLYAEALACVEKVAENPRLLALKATLLWRLGKPDEAEKAANKALEGDSEARALALDTLGELARSRGAFDEAMKFYKRAGVLWRAVGNGRRWVLDLNNVGIVFSSKGKEEEAIKQYQMALEATTTNGLLKGLILGNIAFSQERLGRFQDAIDTYQKAINLAEKSQATVSECYAWNNLALVFERQEQFGEAKHAYEKALELAYKTNETLMIGLTLANLAELDKDYEAMTEAALFLEKAGHIEMADRVRQTLTNLTQPPGETSDRHKAIK